MRFWQRLLDRDVPRDRGVKHRWRRSVPSLAGLVHLRSGICIRRSIVNRWAVIEELGGVSEQVVCTEQLPQSRENQDYSYVYIGFAQDGAEPPRVRWTEGRSIDGKGTFRSDR
jgi:hypothetical protein